MKILKLKDCQEVDVIIKDEEGFGLFYTYLSDGIEEDDCEYKCMTYRGYITDTEATNDKILEQLQSCTGYIGDENSHAEAIKWGFDFWHIDTLENIEEHDILCLKTYTEAIEKLKTIDNKYLIVSVDS